MRIADALPVAWALAGAMRSQWRGPAWWHARQAALLSQQLAHAAATVPFYRQTYARMGIGPDAIRSVADLERLPIVTRAQIQERPEAFLSSLGDRRAWRRSHTSGSTGRPLVSWFDSACWLHVKYVLKTRRLLASGWRPGQRVIIVEAIAPEALMRHAERDALPGEQRLKGRRYLSVFEPPAQHLDAYRRFRPHYVYAFPSYLAALADVWDAPMRKTVPLRALMTSAEWLPPAARRRLQEGFGAPVLDVYGSTECKEIAWQCREQDGYHVNMDSVIVEVVDAEGRQVGSGVTGELLVTTLTNRAMPLIRYALGDLGQRMAGACRCGRGLTRLQRIEGRVNDRLTAPDEGFLSPYALTTAIEAYPAVLQYKVVQREAQRLEVQVVLRPGVNGSALEAIASSVRRCAGGRWRVEVRSMPAIPPDASGKQRVVEGLRRPSEVP